MGKMTGAMNIVPSGGREPSVLDFIFYLIRHGNPLKDASAGSCGPHAMKRANALDKLNSKRIEITKPYPDHIYLKMVGVRGDCQGKGIGGRMFRPLFSAADSLGVPVYLETESEENEKCYQHYGFRTEETIVVAVDGDTSPDAKFKMYLMLRMPQAATGRQQQQQTDVTQ